MSAPARPERVLGAQRIRPLAGPGDLIEPIGEPCGHSELATLNTTGDLQVLQRGLETWRPYNAVIAHDAGSLCFYLALLDEEPAGD